jgi:PIN domain-containing protein
MLNSRWGPVETVDRSTNRTRSPLIAPPTTSRSSLNNGTATAEQGTWLSPIEPSLVCTVKSMTGLVGDQSSFGSAVQAVLDADVLFQAAPTRLLLGAAQSGLYRARWTDQIVQEARRNLTEARRDGPLRALEGNLNLVRDPLIGGFEDLAANFTATDPKDCHVAAAAAAISARYLVTRNVRDFDVGEAAAHGFEVVHFDVFGERLAVENVAALARHVDRTPPGRLLRYLELLAKSMPRTFTYLEVVFAEELASGAGTG